VKKDNDIIKCAFCNWTTKRWRRNKKGKLISGMKSLQHHAETAHHDKYEDIMQGLEASPKFNCPDCGKLLETNDEVLYGVCDQCDPIKRAGFERDMKDGLICPT
jgi:rubrerythrin